jgi:hypothetical protein
MTFSNSKSGRTKVNKSKYAITPTVRDMQTFKFMAERGALTTLQISTLLYPLVHRTNTETGERYLDLSESNAYCRERLKRHYDAGNIRRIEQYQLLKEGKKAYLYALTQKGANILARYLGCEVQDLNWRKTDARLHKDAVEHLILDNDFWVSVTKATMDTPGICIDTWHDMLTLKSTHSKDVMKILTSTGKTQTTTIIPDDYVVLYIPVLNVLRKHLFIEIDRATETVFSSNESRYTCERKFKSYLEYFKRGGYYEKRYKTYKGRVLTITTSEKRLANLKRVAEEAGGMQRFWFTIFDKVNFQTVFFSPIWQRARDTGLYSLFSEEEQALIKAPDLSKSVTSSDAADQLD